MNLSVVEIGFKNLSMGIPVLSEGGKTATFTRKFSAPQSAGIYSYYISARNYSSPKCFESDAPSPVQRWNDLVVSESSSDLGPCLQIGDTSKISSGLLECRQFYDDKLRWVSVSPDPQIPPMPTGGSNLTSCALREARAFKFQPWNVGFPRGDSYGTPTLPTSGLAKVQLIAIEFPDALGTDSELRDAEAQIAEFNRWFDFNSNGTLSFEWQFPKQWFRMSKPVPQYGFQKGVRDKVHVIATEMISLADPHVDFSGSDFVFVLFPRTITLGEPDVGTANDYLQSSEGRIKNLFGGAEYFYKRNFELWSFWVHEWGHPMGLAGHTPRSGISIMDNQNGHSVVLNSWDAFFTGWLGSDQLYCMPTTMTSLEISLVPLERMQHGPRGVIIPVTETNALVVESHRAEGWGTRMGKGRYGLAVYWVDTTMDTDRYAGSSGYIDTDAGARWADHVVPTGKSRIYDLLLAGDTVTYKGITVNFVKTGDVDTVVISR